jgi:hypothetical protein
MKSKYLNPHHLKFRVRHLFANYDGLQIKEPDYCITYEENGVKAEVSSWTDGNGETHPCMDITAFREHFGADDGIWTESITMGAAFALGKWLTKTSGGYRPSLPKRIMARINGNRLDW